LRINNNDYLKQYIYENNIKITLVYIYKKEMTTTTEPKQRKASQPRKTTKPKMISVKKYVRILNLLLTASGYGAGLPQKTVEESESIALLSYYLERLFPYIINYNVYNLSKKQMKYIMRTLYKYADSHLDEEDAIIHRLKVNEVVRTFPVKKRTMALPILEDMDDIQSLEALVTNAKIQRELDPEIWGEPDSEIWRELKPVVEQPVEPEPEPMVEQPMEPEPVVEPEPEPVVEQPIPPVEQPIPQPKKRKIPKYEPPLKYTEQQDTYSGYETYGEYKQKGLVFETATEYMNDLNKVSNGSKLFDREEIIKKIKAQLKKPSSFVLIDYLDDDLLAPIHRRAYDITVTDPDSEELDMLAQQTEALDEMLDVIAKSQYSLDQARYKQLLNDMLTILNKPSKHDMIDIVKNFFVKYKFIPAKKMVDLGNVDNYKSMIEQGDNYIIPPKKELHRHDTEYDYEAHYKRMEKEREESRRLREKSREESRKENEKELKQMKKEAKRRR
jgi:hypothetical protein